MHIVSPELLDKNERNVSEVLIPGTVAQMIVDPLEGVCIQERSLPSVSKARRLSAPVK